MQRASLCAMVGDDYVGVHERETEMKEGRKWRGFMVLVVCVGGGRRIWDTSFWVFGPVLH